MKKSFDSVDSAILLAASKKMERNEFSIFSMRVAKNRIADAILVSEKNIHSKNLLIINAVKMRDKRDGSKPFHGNAIMINDHDAAIEAS